MRAMICEEVGKDLVLRDRDVPRPQAHQVLVEVRACGVCRTDLHLVDGELPEAPLPIIPGHEVVGEIVELGAAVGRLRVGDRVGIPWLGWTCGSCRYCSMGLENLCDEARFTGFTLNGGFAEFAVADERYCFPLTDGAGYAEAAPLLCAGLIGYRSYRMRGTHVHRLGLYGFGAAAHIVAQIAVFEDQEVYAFTREGDRDAQAFARSLGACWAGSSTDLPPDELDAAIIFAPVGALVPAALRAVRKGGVVVCAGIHMSAIPEFPYSILWGERSIVSVANLERRDGEELLELAARIPIETDVRTFGLEDANRALKELREGTLGAGAAVLTMTD